MPYTSVSELPAHVKKYSAKVQRQWMHVFNSTYSKVLNETKSAASAEKRAFKSANSVLKKRFKEGQNVSGESHSDYFSMLIDSYLKNLKG